MFQVAAEIVARYFIHWLGTFWFLIVAIVWAGFLKCVELDSSVLMNGYEPVPAATITRCWLQLPTAAMQST